MKFNDGFWRQASGIKSIYPQAVRDYEVGKECVTLYAPTRRIENRRNTLNNPVAEIRLFSTAPDVLGIRISHHAGGRQRGPRFDLPGNSLVPLAVQRKGAELHVAAGRLTAVINLEGDFGIRFIRDGELVTEAGGRSIGLAETDDGAHFIFQRLALSDGETLYGLGERSTPLVKNGQSLETWNDDGGPSSWHSYKSIPFFLSAKGWGVLVNSPGRVAFELGSEFSSQAQFSLETQELEYFLIAGDSPKQVLERYTGLAGRPGLPPRWSFGLWLSTSFVTQYDEETVAGFVDGMAARQLPLSVVHFDCFWMREFRWCDFQWDREAFPDPEGMLKRLAERGLKVSVWINPYIAQRSALFEEARAKGYLLKKPDGDVWQWDTWQAGMGFVDFTNPQAREWFAAKLSVLLDMGVDCFKTDFGERLPLDVVYHDDSDPALMHNFYSYLYNRTVFETLEAHRGGGNAVVFARAATVGSQRFAVHWGGDPEPTYNSMAETLRSGLSLGLSGFGFWSHDIGGFEGEPTPDLFMRWAVFGLLSSHSRLHGSVSHRVPWQFGERAVEVVRQFTELKMRLMPYLIGVAEEACSAGLPVMRAMVLEFPNDPNCRFLDRQYMLGPDLLVAPVMRSDGKVQVYIPDGEWTHLLSGETVTGPLWRDEIYSYDSLPLYVRPGAILPWGGTSDRADYDYRENLTLRIYGAGSTQARRELRVPGKEGESGSHFVADMGMGKVEIAGQSDFPVTFCLVGAKLPVELHGGVARLTAAGAVLEPTGTNFEMRAMLATKEE